MMMMMMRDVLCTAAPAHAASQSCLAIGAAMTIVASTNARGRRIIRASVYRTGDLGCWRRPARRLACSSALVTKRSTERNVNVTRGPETSSVNHLRRLNGKSLDSTAARF